jgi:hypothetical protein
MAFLSVETFLIIALIIILIAIIAIVIVQGQTKVTFVGPPNTVVPNPLSFGYSCLLDGAVCAFGLTCSSALGICVQAPGSCCSDFSDCDLGLQYCSGICVSGPFGNLSQNCPCFNGLVCSPSHGNTYLLTCLGPSGNSCTTNEECLSGNCLSTGVCSGGLVAGDSCTVSQECEQGLVCEPTFFYCQPPGIVSGQLNAGCFPNSPPPVEGGTYPTAGCNEGLLCDNNFCVTAAIGLGTNCTDIVPCIEPLACLDNNNNDCLPGDVACQCLYEDSANSCLDGICTTNYTCNSGNNICLGNSGQPCFANDQCLSSSCNFTTNLFTLSSINGVTGATGFIGSSDLTWTKQSTIPTAGSVKRMVGFTNPSNTTQDILYAVCTDGLYNYNNNSNTWSLIIPNPLVTSITGGTSTKLLIDFAVNSTSLMLVAFLETVTYPSIQANYTVYTLTNNNILTPFNVISNPPNIPGTQYGAASSGLIVLSILSISISTSNDVLLLSNSGTIPSTPFVKVSTTTVYTMRNYTIGSVVGPVPITNVVETSFYYDIPEGTTSSPINFPPDLNIAYVSEFINSDNFDCGLCLQFNGNISGSVLPKEPVDFKEFEVFDYSIYSPQGLGMQSSTIEIVSLDLSLNSTFVFLIIGGLQFKIPGYVNNNSHPLVTSNFVYLSSPGICQ